MTTVNPQLQERAGRNIGIEPQAGLTFAQSAAAAETTVNPTGETVILTCPEGTARAAVGSRDAGGAGVINHGFIVNNTATPFSYDVWFRDDEGNEVVIGNGTASPNAVTEFVYAAWGGSALAPEVFVLNPGEEIFLRPGGAT